MKYKEPKTLEEQIEYLKTDKRVVFNTISENEAIEILRQYGYINVISPFKFYFAEKSKNGNVIKDSNGKHIYLEDVEFSQYFEKYKLERAKYPIIYKNISNFENRFNSIIAYECIHFYNICDSEKFDLFIDDLKNNVEMLDDYPSVKNKYLSSLENIRTRITDFNSVYILMDRLTLNEAFTIFKCCKLTLKKIIFSKLMKLNCTFDQTRISQFENVFSKIVMIRNYVYHNNSITVLTRYYKIGTKELRKINDRKQFSKLIKILSKP